MPRPPVDVVIPFRGSQADLRALLARARGLRLSEGDTVVIVDNRRRGEPVDDPRVVRAPARQTSYHARNRGAQRGSAPWIVFLDADVDPSPDLLDRYFETPPADEAAVLVGRVDDEPVDRRAPLAARYAMLSRSMAQVDPRGRWAYAQTANCAVRRTAFEAAGGFVETIRSGGDADLCFRLRDAGWTLEDRPRAAVVHRSRRSLGALVRQHARHGAGAAWLDRRHPGSFPSALGPGILRYTARRLAAAARRRARGDRDGAVLAAVGLLCHWAFELGRLLPNEPGR
ncbi:MAG: glycosyltransferase [Actinobacteria bacterium]|nr:MAG: glycosyltransferase [Actinomycetota bacterium]